jgi:hypothetical protein
MPASAVEPLLSNVERALDWLAGHDGFVAYQSSGKGLTNHGWKDSGDGVQHADGRLAAGRLALSEVQAYAYRAAVDAAWMLESFGREGADRWRSWAAQLAARFREAFWCPGGYPAIALDGSGERVDSIASNMGHLLGTGLLGAEESAAVAGKLAELRSPFGIRTVAPSCAVRLPLVPSRLGLAPRHRDRPPRPGARRASGGGVGGGPGAALTRGSGSTSGCRSCSAATTSRRRTRPPAVPRRGPPRPVRRSSPRCSASTSTCRAGGSRSPRWRRRRSARSGCAG